MNGHEFINDPYWKIIWKQFKNHSLGMIGMWTVVLFTLVGVYAPFLASSKPFCVFYNGEWYFPLFRYLPYAGFYTKRLDIFFNLLIYTLPLLFVALKVFAKSRRLLYISVLLILTCQIVFFIYYAFGVPADPEADRTLALKWQKKKSELTGEYPTWDDVLQHMSPYKKLNLLLNYQQRKFQQQKLQPYTKQYVKTVESNWLAGAIPSKKAELVRQGIPFEKIPNDEKLKEMILEETPAEVLERKLALPTLWQIENDNENQELSRGRSLMKSSDPSSEAYKRAKAKVDFILQRRQWLEEESANLRFEVWPLVRPFHWEDDAGGEQSLNRYIPWWELTRINRKDLVAALIFGVRISLVVGITAVGLSLLIGIPVGAFAGFYGGTVDIIICRILEVWEAMPTFFMLLMVVAIAQSKSIFLVISVIGIFGWTGFSRYIRGEFFKQRHLPYVEACTAQGFSDSYVIYTHILPNAIPPLLTLLPFAVMGAITSEAGLSFLGLGEEGSCSWGVLMDEGRTAFPGEAYLLWPPAILLTILLIAIALVGDSLRDALDPKMHR